MAKVIAPVASTNGSHCGVEFVDGVGHTENPGALSYFRRAGYTVTNDTPVPAEPAAAQTQPEQVPKPPAKSAPKADWVIYAVARGADEAEAMAASKAALVEAYS